jgi:hypothetical protein
MERVHSILFNMEGDGHHWAPGVGWLHSHELGATYRGRGWQVRLEYGLDGRVATPDFQSVDAGMGYGMLRGAIQSWFGGLALELALGGGADQAGGLGLFRSGAFLTWYYIDLGYTWNVAFGSEGDPAWLPMHQLALRIRIPVFRSSRRPNLRRFRR